MKVNNAASWLIVLTLLILALSYGQSIIVPFIVAALIWFVVKKLRNLLDKVGFIRKYIPGWLKSLVATFFIFSLLTGVGQMLTVNIENIVSSYPEYEPNFLGISSEISRIFKVDITEEIHEFFQKMDFATYLSSFFNSLSEILGSTVLILFYVLFLFIEESLFQQKIKLIFKDPTKFRHYNTTMKKIDKMLSSYISLKSLVSFITSTLSFIVFLSIGIDSPFFWASLIFLMSFIPSVGPIVATVLASIFSLVQFGEFIPFFIILFVIGGIQMLVGNYVEPRLMGNTLNISPLVAVISLALWGSIWGITGMLLSVPITVALIIIMAQFPSTRPVAILLSEKGRV